MDEDDLILTDLEADLSEEDDESLASDSHFSYISDSTCLDGNDLFDFKGLFASTNNAVQDPRSLPRENVKSIMGDVLSCLN